MADEAAYAIAIGDTFETHAGCAFRIQEGCKTKFDNATSFNGETFLPGPDDALEFPNAR